MGKPKYRKVRRMSALAPSLKATRRRETDDDPIAGLKRAQDDYKAAKTGLARSCQFEEVPLVDQTARVPSNDFGNPFVIANEPAASRAYAAISECRNAHDEISCSDPIGLTCQTRSQ